MVQTQIKLEHRVLSASQSRVAGTWHKLRSN